MINKQALQAYQEVKKEGSLQYADPYNLVLMLMQGALDKLSLAKGFMAQHDIEQKGANISLAISIIDALQSSLDQEKGGDIAKNLYDLYDYVMKELVQANLKNDSERLDHVIAVIKTIQSGWEQIPDEHKP